MAIPTPDSLLDLVRVTADTPEAFIAKLSTQMADPELVKNGYRGAGLFSFYVPGAMRPIGHETVRKQLKEAGYDVHQVEQIVGYMPPNLVIDFRSAGPYDPDVTGPSTFPWIHVQVSKTPPAS
ncbi:hypothetical protein ST201phi2-1p313 [Pseudomonas phage 201phi2-1]|uniref:Uncharacterized protein n=1 Tax=Pseudomonas phage 201phi2-1 TaxID=198110 RepID=B3FJH3_BP201|nr:hypothetical protein ST201phi2-1p313 [Pseudomonas phage 201phi2-1]ABY63139.1 protein of unknown function [Pseudomonas phage 201phi2-1]